MFVRRQPSGWRILRPPTVEERRAQRLRRRWTDRFVFLNVSAHALSKGTDLLLKAFSRVAVRFPEAMLALKGSDDVYHSREVGATVDPRATDARAARSDQEPRLVFREGGLVPRLPGCSARPTPTHSVSFGELQPASPGGDCVRLAPHLYFRGTDGRLHDRCVRTAYPSAPRAGKQAERDYPRTRAG
jgi:hypothetical protein